MSNRHFHRRNQSVGIEPMDDSSDNSNQTWLQEGPNSMQLKRSEMNYLVLDYMIHEGFKEAAEKFKEEAGIKLDEEKNSADSITKHETAQMMDKRIEIKHFIEEGDVLKAQFLINLHYPEFLDNHKKLYSKLQQQHLIELIRQQKINEVLSYVHDQLSVEELRDLSEIERTLALLAYENPDRSPYSDLLQHSHRLQLASEINDQILQETTGNVEPNKPRLVFFPKFVFWTQSELERKKIQYPKMTDLATGTIVEPRR